MEYPCSKCDHITSFPGPLEVHSKSVQLETKISGCSERDFQTNIHVINLFTIQFDLLVSSKHDHKILDNHTLSQHVGIKGLKYSSVSCDYQSIIVKVSYDILQGLSSFVLLESNEYVYGKVRGDGWLLVLWRVGMTNSNGKMK